MFELGAPVNYFGRHMFELGAPVNYFGHHMFGLGAPVNYFGPPHVWAHVARERFWFTTCLGSGRPLIILDRPPLINSDRAMCVFPLIFEHVMPSIRD